jgi:hypothetical protein
MGASILTLHRGDERAIVEAGSQAEADLKAIGFAEEEAEKPSAPVVEIAPAPEPDPPKRRNAGRGRG